MPSLRTLLQQQNFYEASLGQVMEVVHGNTANELTNEPAPEIEPNDLLDYTLNCGHRHRLLEGWEIKDGQQHIVSSQTNTYPERLFFYTLAKKAVDECYQGELQTELRADLKRFLRKEYRLLDPKLQEDWDLAQTVQYWDGQQQQLCQRLDGEEVTSRWAVRLYTLQTLERVARQLAENILRQPNDKANHQYNLPVALTERQIHLPAEQYGEQHYHLPGLLGLAALHLQNNARTALICFHKSQKVMAMVRECQQLERVLL